MPALTDRSHALRASRVGASEVAALMGLDPYKSAMTVWARIALGEQIQQTPRMRIGAALEQPIARLWADLAGERIRANTRTRVLGNLAATADAFVLSRGGLLEVKWSAGSSIWSGDAVPDPVYWQAVAQSAVYGRTGRTITIVALVGADLREWVFEPTRAERKEVRRVVDAFITAHIDTGEMPIPIYPAELDAYLKLTQGTDPEARRPATKAEEDAAAHYLNARDEARAFDNIATQARADLLGLIAHDAKPRVIGDGWVYTNTRDRVTVVDNRGWEGK